MSGELWRANILLFEASVLIFDILTLKKRYGAMLLSLYFAGQRDSALFPRAWSRVLEPRMKMDHLGSLLIGVVTLPPSYPSWHGHELLASLCEARAAAEKWRGWILGSQRAPPGSSSSRWSSWEETESWHLPGEPKTLKKSMSGNECCTELQEMP